MTNPPTLQDLLLRWEKQEREGSPTPPEEFCREAPDLLEAFLAHLRKRAYGFSTAPTKAETPNGVALSTLAAPAMPLLPIVPGYEIQAQLGRGGIGVVYLARDVRLDRQVALKMLRPGSLTSEELVQRFRLESQALAKLDHPHVVPIYDDGEQDGQLYFTMKYLPGGSLFDNLERFRAAPRRAVELMVRVTRAVQYLHEKKILHRDLKPLNILLSEEEQPFVTDFGLAKYMDMDSELTQAGEILGTHAYMAPEQALGKVEEFSPATDVWALGVMLYELLVGQKPFQGANRERLLNEIVTTDPPAPRKLKPSIPRPLAIVVMKCLEKEPGRRFASAGVLADELQRWLDDKPILTQPEPWPKRAIRFGRRHPIATLTVGFVLGLAVALVVVWRLNDPERPLRAMQQELHAGMTVRLQDKAGQPRWFHWRSGALGTPVIGPKGELVIDTSFKFSLLELLRDPPPSYRLTAEVRHDQYSQLDGEVGLFFDLKEHLGNNGVFLSLCTLAFHDTTAFPPGTNPTPLYLRVFQQDAFQQATINGKTAAGKSLRFVPSQKQLGDGPWRRLEAVVSPEEVRTFFDGNLSTIAPRKKIAEKARTLKPTIPEGDSAFTGAGSVGLFVHAGAAAFKNIRIEPLRQ